MDKLSCMQAFCNIVKEGGFSAAARKSGKSKVLLSRSLSHLEAELGVRLLQRTTRKMSLTPEGKAYYQACLPLLDELHDIDESIKSQHQVAKGLIKIAIPSESFSQTYLIPLIIQFKHLHPDIEFELVLSDRHIDIVEDGYDMAVRIGRLPDSSLIARKLSDVELLLCATPHYLKSIAAINKPEDLEQHQLIIDSNYQNGLSWTFSSTSNQLTIKPKGSIKVNSCLACISFLMADMGLGLCPSFAVKELLAQQKLQQLLPQWNVMKGGVYLMYSHRKHLSAKINLFSQFLIDNFDKS